jgi:O-antigen/teichoic acid export membrane protein
MSSIAKQAVHTFGFRALTFACRAGLVVLLARLLTPGDYGVYSLVTTVGTFGVILVGLNLHAYVYRIVPGQEAADQLAIFKATFLFETCAASALVALVLLSGQLPTLVQVLNAGGYERAFALGLVLLVGLVATTETTQFLTAQSRIETANWVDFLAQASWVPVLAMLWLAGVEVSVVVVCAAQVAGSLAALVYASRQVGLRAWWEARPRWQTLKPGVAFSLPMIVPALSLYSLKLADRFMLSYFGTLEDVGVYSFSYTLVNTVYTFTAWVIFNTFGPRIVAAHNRGDFPQRDVLQTYMLKLALTCFAAGLIALLLVARPLIETLTRPEYLRAIAPLPLVGLSYVFIIITFPAHYVLLMENRVGALVMVDVAGMVVGVVADLLLIPTFSYLGAAVASALGFAVIMAGKYAASRAHTALRRDLLFSVSDEMRLVRRYYMQIWSSVP